MGPSTTQYSQRGDLELISNNAIQLSVFITIILAWTQTRMR